MSLLDPNIITTTVTGRYVDPTGEAVEGIVRFEPTAIIKHLASNTVIANTAFEVQLKGDGSFAVTLPVSQPDLIPTDFLYIVTEIFNSQILRQWNIRLDFTMGPTVSLVALSPAIPPNLATQFPSLQEVAVIASDLDQDALNRIDILNTLLVTVEQTLGTALGPSDVGVNVASLVNGKIPAEQLPPIPQGNYYPVASQAAMLALAASRGDYALRSDVNKTFVLSQDDPTVLANWLELPSGGAVASVNGKTGTVSLSYLDVNAAVSTHTHTSLPSLTSLNATTATITTAQVTTGKFGGVSTLLTNLDSTGIKLYDSGGTQWSSLQHSVKGHQLIGGFTRWTASGQIFGGRTVQAPSITTNTATAWTQLATEVLTDPRAGTTNAFQVTWRSDYDSATSVYTDARYTLDTQTITYSGVAKKSQLRMDPQQFLLTLTNPNLGDMVWGMSNASGANTLTMTNVLNWNAPQSTLILGDPTSTSQKYYSVKMKNSTDTLVYERRSYLAQSTISSIADVLMVSGAEVARTQLNPDGSFTVGTPATGNVPVQLVSDTGPQTSNANFVVTAGVFALNVVEWRIKNGMCSLKLSGTITPELGIGNIANTTILNSIPAQLRPATQFEPMHTSGTGPIVAGGVFSTGIVQLFATTASTANTAISLHAVYPI